MPAVVLQQAAFMSTHEGWGTAVIIGVTKAGEMVSAMPILMVTGRTWKGSAFGGTILYIPIYQTDF